MKRNNDDKKIVCEQPLFNNNRRLESGILILRIIV